MRTISKEELAKIIEKHGRWLRGEDGGERADLTGADLTCVDLTGSTLSEADLIGADLTWARLDGTKREENNVRIHSCYFTTIRGGRIRLGGGETTYPCPSDR